MGLKLPGRESHDGQQADQPGPWVGSVPVKGPAEEGTRERLSTLIDSLKQPWVLLSKTSPPSPPVGKS